MTKKILAFVLATALLTAGSTTAFAHHGGSGHHGKRAVSYSVCNYADCNLAETHTHDGCYYYGHYYGDGHDYHESTCGASHHCH